MCSLRSRSVGKTAVENGLEKGISARNGVSHHPKIGFDRELLGAVAFGEFDPRRAQCVAHRRINPAVASRHGVSGLRRKLRDAAHAAGAAALFSEHHFDATPATDAMADTLTGMADAGADIAKLAVMPRCAADAARLLEATARAADARPDTPLITMSMGPLGAVTRFCGGAFGSCATFGVTSGTSASAPGQPPADLLKAKLITAPL